MLGRLFAAQCASAIGRASVVGTEIAEEEPEPCARGHLQAAREFRSEAPSIGQLSLGSDQANGFEKCERTSRAQSQRLHIIVAGPLCLASRTWRVAEL